MPIEVHPVAYGPPASQRLAALVADAKGGDPLRPVTVVVPTNYVGVTVRRALAAAGPGIAAVRFLTAYRLAELLGSSALAARGRRPVSTPVVAAAIRRGLAGQPGIFTPVAEHPSTVEALERAHRELRDLTPAARSALAATSRRAAEVVRIHLAVAKALGGGWYDETDLIDAAVRAIDERAPFVEDIGTVVLYLPQEIGLGAARLFQAVAGIGRLAVVAGLTGEANADVGVRQTLARLEVVVDAVPARPPPVEPEVTVVTASDADDEVRAAVRRVIEAARGGVPFERMAVCYGTTEPYARLVGEQLVAAAVPHNGTATVHLRERLAARTLLALLALVDEGATRQRLFEVLASAPVRTADGGLVPTAAWERVSREAGVVRGRAHWDERLARTAAALDAEAVAAEADPESPVWLPDRLRRQARDARDLRRFALDLLDRVDPARAPTTWRGLADLAHQLLQRTLGGDGARGGWPAAEVAAADKVAAAVDRLAGLDEVDPSVTVDIFRRTLELELDADLQRVGRLGDGVFVGPVSMVLGQQPEVLVVLGLAEGSFPTRPTDDGLLPDHERRAAKGQLALSTDAVGRQRRHLLAAMAATTGQVVLCLPRGDLRRSSERIASRWVLDVVSRRCGEAVNSSGLADRREPWIAAVPSFAAGIERVDFAPTAQEHRLRTLASGVDAGPLCDLALGRALRLLRARRSRAFTAFDGNLAGLPVPSPFTSGEVVSATRLEAWARCPHAYLLTHLLRVKQNENPEDLLQMSPLDKGSLIHDTLDRFIAAVLARPPAEQPGPDDAWTAADLADLLAVFAEVGAGYEARGLTGRDLFWRRDQGVLRRDLAEFLRRDDERRREKQARPVATELAFGGGRSRGSGPRLGPVTVDVGDGRAVRFRGSADRVDRIAGGLLVVDYKSGSKTPYAKISADRPDLDGTRLQLPVYALAARAAVDEPDATVEAEYWFVTTDKGGWATVGYCVDDAVLARFGRVLATIGDGIAGGVFPLRPARPGFQFRVECAYCDPDGLGTAEPWGHWERKRDAPELEAYLALVEPDG